MTDTEILHSLIAREGGYVDAVHDRGGATNMGITAKTLGAWRHLGRQATRREVQALTTDEAIAIYRSQYIEQPGFTREHIPHDRLRAALIDEGVNTGPMVAIRHLQEALGVLADGVLGPVTKAAVRSFASGDGLLLAVVRLRCLRYGRIVQADQNQARFLVGWLSRSFEMLA